MAALLAMAALALWGPKNPPRAIPLRTTQRTLMQDVEQINKMPLREIKAELQQRGVSTTGLFEKQQLIQALREARTASPKKTQQSNESTKPDEQKPIKDDVNQMPLREIKAELQQLGVSTSGLFEKQQLVEALRKARTSSPKRNAPSSTPDDVNDVAEGKTIRMPRKSAESGGGGGMPGSGTPGGFGGMPGGFGGMPGGFGGMPGGFGDVPGGFGGMGGMGGLSDILNGMGGFGGMPGGGSGGGVDAMGMVQKLMNNPKAMALFQQAQSNPKIMSALQDVQRQGFNPQVMSKYANDPELMAILKEFQELM